MKFAPLNYLLPIAMISAIGLSACASAPQQRTSPAVSATAATPVPALNPVADKANPIAADSVAAGSLGTLDDRYTRLGATGGRLFKLDPAQSDLRIYAFRAGSSRQLGHNHILSAPRFLGYFWLSPTGMDTSRFELEFNLDALVFDSPALRAQTGESFASNISPGFVEATRQHMLEDASFAAKQFPKVLVQSLRIAGESPKYAVQINLQMHGQQRDLWVPLTVKGLPGALTISGSFVFSQSDFGVKAYSILGGLLQVQDAVVVEFTLIGTTL